MKLGELIDILEKANPDDDAVIAWPELHTLAGWRGDYGKWAGTFSSYRGYYDQLALSGSQVRRTVADLLADARAADGATFEGWKGGDYTMDRDTTVWAAGRGDTGSLALGKPRQGYGCLTFPTFDCSDYQGW